MNWLSSLPIIAQIIALMVKGYFEADQEKKEKRKELNAEAKDAIKSGNPSKLTVVLDKLRS